MGSSTPSVDKRWYKNILKKVNHIIVLKKKRKESET